MKHQYCRKCARAAAQESFSSASSGQWCPRAPRVGAGRASSSNDGLSEPPAAKARPATVKTQAVAIPVEDSSPGSDSETDYLLIYRSLRSSRQQAEKANADASVLEVLKAQKATALDQYRASTSPTKRILGLSASLEKSRQQVQRINGELEQLKTKEAQLLSLKDVHLTKAQSARSSSSCSLSPLS